MPMGSVQYTYLVLKARKPSGVISEVLHKFLCINPLSPYVVIMLPIMIYVMTFSGHIFYLSVA